MPHLGQSVLLVLRLVVNRSCPGLGAGAAELLLVRLLFNRCCQRTGAPRDAIGAPCRALLLRNWSSTTVGPRAGAGTGARGGATTGPARQVRRDQLEAGQRRHVGEPPLLERLHAAAPPVPPSTRGAPGRRSSCAARAQTIFCQIAASARRASSAWTMPGGRRWGPITFAAGQLATTIAFLARAPVSPGKLPVGRLIHPLARTLLAAHAPRQLLAGWRSPSSSGSQLTGLSLWVRRLTDTEGRPLPSLTLREINHPPVHVLQLQTFARSAPLLRTRAPAHPAAASRIRLLMLPFVMLTDPDQLRDFSLPPGSFISGQWAISADWRQLGSPVDEGKHMAQRKRRRRPFTARRRSASAISPRGAASSRRERPAASACAAPCACPRPSRITELAPISGSRMRAPSPG